MLTLIVLGLLLAGTVSLVVDGIWLWRRNQLYRFRYPYFLPFFWCFAWVLCVYLFGWWGLPIVPLVVLYCFFLIYMGEI